MHGSTSCARQQSRAVSFAELEAVDGRQDQAGNTHLLWPLSRFSSHCMASPHPTSPLVPARSRCGNFGFVGSESGRVDRYNMQSGMHRGSYCRDPKASRSWDGWRRLWAAAVPGAVWLNPASRWACKEPRPQGRLWKSRAAKAART